jgi:myo-inositol-1(or 4)-monophosphatase
MDHTTPRTLIDDVVPAVRQAGELLLPHYGATAHSLKTTSGHEVRDIVTALDVSTEEYLYGALTDIAPDIGFRGEETGQRGNPETFWLVDPIDGTSHFVRGLPFCTTMVALVDHGQVTAAIIHDFVGVHTYWAVRGHGAYCDSEPIHVSARPLAASMLAIEMQLVTPAQHALHQELRSQAGALINTLNAGFELAAVASGRFDGRVCIEGFGYDWDYAAGSLIVSEAGGTVTNIGSRTYDYRNHDFVMASPAVHDALTQGPMAPFPTN